MKTQIQQRTDERDNRRVSHWLVIVVVVLLVGVLSYNFFAGERTGAAPAAQPNASQSSVAPQTPQEPQK
jgi:type VI protein secretion system component VasK